MAKHRFFCRELGAGTLTLDREESRHAATVLRLRAGAAVGLFDGAGRVAEGVARQVARGAVTVEVDAVETVERPAGPSLTLLTAMPRAARQQTLFEKCTELGMTRIVPVRFDRSTVRPKSDAVAKWRRITIEAAKQCAAAFVPEIVRPRSFAESLEELGASDQAMYGAVGDGVLPLLEALGSIGGGRLAVWIGPEGGLTTEEAEALVSAGARPVSLGPLVLRVETAAIAVATAVALWREVACGMTLIKRAQSHGG
jgi:16S rRNA (uracil1498-N3)-methyltransferase